MRSCFGLIFGDVIKDLLLVLSPLLLILRLGLERVGLRVYFLNPIKTYYLLNKMLDFANYGLFLFLFYINIFYFY